MVSVSENTTLIFNLLQQFYCIIVDYTSRAGALPFLLFPFLLFRITSLLIVILNCNCNCKYNDLYSILSSKLHLEGFTGLFTIKAKCLLYQWNSDYSCFL